MTDELISLEGELPIEIAQGDPFDLELQCLDSDGNPVILTGYSGRAQMREIAGGTLQIEFEVNVSQTSTGDDVGLVSIHADESDTATVRRDGYWDLDLISDIAPKLSVIEESPATLTRQVTTS